MRAKGDHENMTVDVSVILFAPTGKKGGIASIGANYVTMHDTELKKYQLMRLVRKTTLQEREINMLREHIGQLDAKLSEFED